MQFKPEEYLGVGILTAFSSFILWVNSHRRGVGGIQTRTGGVSAVFPAAGLHEPIGVH